MKTGIRMAVAMVAAVSSGAMAAPFSVSSNDMRDGQPLAQQHWFAGFGCTEQRLSAAGMEKRPGGSRSSRSPSGIPMPTGSGWWHWTVVNIASSVSLPAGAGDKQRYTAGRAVRGRNDLAMPASAAPVRRRR